MRSDNPPPIDANVIIRYFIGGEPLAQRDAAVRRIDALERGEAHVDLEDVIVAEVVWAIASPACAVSSRRGPQLNRVTSIDRARG